MTLAVVGWAIVHSLWLSTFIAGVTAVTIALLPDRRAVARHALACAGLAVMVIAPLATTIVSPDLLGRARRTQVDRLIDSAVTFPAFVHMRSILIPAVAVFWVGGLLVSLIRVGTEWRRTRALRRFDLHDVGHRVRSALAEVRPQLSLWTDVDIRRSTRVSAPMVIGWLRPIILLPRSASGRLDDGQLRAVLAHELAHVRRRDYLVNYLQIAAETMLFHHPAARWVSRRIRIEREYCCDDVAVALGRNERGYAQALAALDDARDDSRFAVGAAAGTLLDRIQRVVGQPRPALTPTRGVLMLLVASLVASVVLCVAMAVPPSLPLDVKVRVLSPGPTGIMEPSAGAPEVRRRQR